MPTKRLQIVDSITKQADWNQNDETQKDYIRNKPDEDDALAIIVEMGLIEPIVAADGSVFTDSNGALYAL